MLSILLLVVAYGLGSIPSGIWIARAMGLGNPLTQGSGSISPNNLWRLGGPKAAAFTFCADFLKGFVPVLAAVMYWPTDPSPAGLAALCVVFGHCYSLFLFFRGGKGVATMVGALLPLAPVAMLVSIVFGGLVFSAFRSPALAAMLAVLALLGALFALQASPFVIIVAAACGWMVIRQHRANLEKLLRAANV